MWPLRPGFEKTGALKRLGVVKLFVAPLIGQRWNPVEAGGVFARGQFDD